MFDYDDNDFLYAVSGGAAINSNGDLLIRMGDSMAMDMNTGDLHIVSCWDTDEND